MIDINNRRECFFDDFLIDSNKTTASKVLHHPKSCDVVLYHDESWEGDGCTYHNYFYDNGIYRMYYVARDTMINESLKGSSIECEEKYVRICYAESKDGFKWTKPKLNICSWRGSKENNIILDYKTGILDNFFVFKDENKNCPDDKKYKAILQLEKKLYAFYSPDGIHFEKGNVITNKGTFDSLNIIFWDEASKIYRGYIRSFHSENIDESKYENPREWPEEIRNNAIRDIRYFESKDFECWTEPARLDYKGAPDIPLYTNCVSIYERAPHMLIGFPTRYIQRKEWTKSFDYLCGAEKRKERMKIQGRFGVALTDCLFMCSRDGKSFTRYDEAFLRPGVEFDKNWVYGSCYLARGILESKSHIKGAEDELSLFAKENQWSGESTALRRYTIRKDGFVSLSAGCEEKIIVTKPFKFKGDNLFANLSTSAMGYMYFTLTDSDGNSLKSCEMFGDSTDKKIGFSKDLSSFSGKEIVLTIRLKDADLYSIKFN